MSQIAESIHDHLIGSEAGSESSIKEDESLINNLSTINDKLMIRAQNQFTKVKEKEEMVVDIREKLDIIEEKINLEEA